MKSLTLEEFEKLDGQEAILIDVRPEEDFKAGSVNGAVNIPLEQLADRASELPKDKMIYLMCHTGNISISSVDMLNKNGYRVGNIRGGYRSYLSGCLDGAYADEEERIEKTREIERSIIKKFRKSIWRGFTKAIERYDLIHEGDRIAVCISGGKDSMLTAKLLQELQRHGKFEFELVFLCMDPGYHEENLNIIRNNARILGIPLTMFQSGIFDAVETIEKNPCYLCARMRRGHLYSKAQELGCNKIALGHHFDDVIETVLMGMLYGGKIETMMPKLHSTNFEGMELIRPMYMVKEADVKAWRDYNGLHFIQCACNFTENNAAYDGGKKSKRDEMTELIAQFRKTSSVIDSNIFNSVHNVNLRTLIGYHKDGVRYNFLDDYDG